MRVSSIVLGLAAMSAKIITALPTSTNCQVLLPSSLYQVSSGMPATVFPNVAPSPEDGASSVMTMIRNGSYPREIQKPIIASFSVPAKSSNCYLAVVDTIGSRDYSTTNSFAGAPNVHFQSLVGGAVTTAPTFNSAYAKVENGDFATLNFDDWEGEQIILGSTPCYQQASFIAEQAQLAVGGDLIGGIKKIEWLEARKGQDAPEDDTFADVNGLHMLYNCV